MSKAAKATLPMGKRVGKIRKSREDRILAVVVEILVALLVIITLYPLIYVISMCISDPYAASTGKVLLWPVGFNLTALKTVLNDPNVPRYYFNTILYTTLGTLIGVFTTTLAAYPVSRKEFKLRTPIQKYFMFTMFFSGGLIPSFIVNTRFLHLYDTIWILIIPGATSAWYITMTRTFFQSIPNEVIDSAHIDGASEMTVFRSIMLPLSKPILGVLALYYVVGHWNSYFDAMLYISSDDRKPISLYVMSKVIQNNVSDLENSILELTRDQLLSSMQLKYAVIVVTVIPMLVFYPFLSKYLKSGVMVGSLKG